MTLRIAGASSIHVWALRHAGTVLAGDFNRASGTSVPVSTNALLRAFSIALGVTFAVIDFTRKVYTSELRNYK